MTTTPTTVAPPPPASVTALVDLYLSAWNEVDPGLRRDLIQQAWEPECQLVDPPIDGVGHDGVDGVIVALHAHYPGHRFRRVGDVEHHHDAFRTDWELCDPDGGVALAGSDHGILGASGRVQRVTGFFRSTGEVS